MPTLHKDSLEALRERIDLVEVISSHIPLQRAGATYKACCPFHEERTPSFIVQPGDKHYHCYGCGAHGDAISFLMGYQHLSFMEAVQLLAEKFGVPLHFTSEEKEAGPSKKLLREVLEKAVQFYHFYLLHTEEGHLALQYLYERGIDLAFIQQFQIGFSPRGDLLKTFLRKQGYEEKALMDTGLLQKERRKDFFFNRIMIPIQDPMGHVIGFTARKIHEKTFGGKYINSPETPLFKKSEVLFGLNFSRRRIAKEHKCLIVEGQIDAMRLIYEGFDYVVASQGTAFGEGHVKELLHLGIEEVLLALDGDAAGVQAALKIGHLFQKKGIAVFSLNLEEGEDPDTFLRQKGGVAFQEKLSKKEPYLNFLYRHLSRGIDLNIPTKKNQLLAQLVERIRDWGHPVLVYESLKKLAEIADVPESILGIPKTKPSPFLKRPSLGSLTIDGDHVLEVDLLRWLVIAFEQEPSLVKWISLNIQEKDLNDPVCQKVYSRLITFQGEKFDMLHIGGLLEEKELFLLDEITSKRVNRLKIKEGILETLEKILKRNWLRQREELRKLAHLAKEEEEIEITKKLSELIKNPPQIQILT